MKKMTTIAIGVMLTLIVVLIFGAADSIGKPMTGMQHAIAVLPAFGLIGMIFTQRHHVIAGIYPVADFFSGTVYSDIYNMQNAAHITFFIMKGAGAVGTSLITIEACSDAAASATTAIAFRYKLCVSATNEDTYGALTAVAATGLTTNAAANEIYAIEVDAADVIATGYNFVRLKAVEQANDPVAGTVFAILSELRVAGETLPESIS